MVSQIYYAEHEKQLVKLIGSECSGWYAYLRYTYYGTLTMVHVLWYTYYGTLTIVHLL